MIDHSSLSSRMDSSEVQRRLSRLSRFPSSALLFHASLVIAIGGLLGTLFPHHAPDTERFLSEARNLAECGIFSLDGKTPTVRDFPAIPFLLALLLRVGVANPEAWMRWLNAASLGLTALGAALWIRMFLPQDQEDREREGFWSYLALWGVGLSPGLLGSTLFVLTELLYTALFLWGHLFLFRGWLGDSPQKRGWILGGMLLGVACLTRPVSLLYPPFFALACILAFPFAWKKILLRALGSWLILGLIVFPWTMRNYSVTGRWIPVAYGTGVYLYVGASEEWRAEWPDFDPGERLCEEKGISMVEADEMLGRQAIQKIIQDPLAWIRLFPIKLKRFWWDIPGAKRQIRSPLLRETLKGIHALLVIVAMAGVWSLRREPLAIGLFAPLAYTCLLHLMLYTMPRFRVPVEPYLLLLAILAIQAGVSRLQQRREWCGTPCSSSQPLLE